MRLSFATLSTIWAARVLSFSLTRGFGAVSLGVTLLLLGPLAARAVAESSVLRRPALHWTRGDDVLGCVSPRTLAEHVESLVGPVLVRASEADNTIEAHVESVAPGKLRVRVRVVDVTGAKVGERTFEQVTAHCAELTPSIVFVIGMVIDPDVAAHGLPPELVAMIAGGERPPEQVLLDELDHAPAPAEAQESATTVLAEQSAPAKPPPPPPARRQLSALLRGSYGEVPRALAALDLRFLHTLPRHLAVLGYLRGGVQLGNHELENGRALAFGSFDAGLLLCGGHTPDRALRLMGCLGAEASSALVHGRGLAINKLDIASAPAAVVQLTLRWRWRDVVGLVASIHGRLAAVERDIVYRDGDGKRLVLATLPRPSFGFALGPSFEF